MSRGHDRERAVVHLLRRQDWVAFRMPGSLGEFDVCAMRRTRMCGMGRFDHWTREVRFIEVKSTVRGPYAGFGPRDRADLVAVAELAGAEPWLAWWPPRGKLRFIGKDEWPR